MKRKVLTIMATVILTVGTVTAVYAKSNSNSSSFGFTGTMMNRSNTNYNNMIDIMRENGLDTAANAMKNGDINAMNQFMNNITDEQYNQMIDIMKENGYGNMASMMGSVSRGEMVNLHNSMMGR